MIQLVLKIVSFPQIVEKVLATALKGGKLALSGVVGLLIKSVQANAASGFLVLAARGNHTSKTRRPLGRLFYWPPLTGWSKNNGSAKAAFSP